MTETPPSTRPDHVGSASVPPLPRQVRIGYGLGSLGTGTFGTVPGLILLYYLTNVLAVPAAIAGVAVLLPKAWDVFVNPLMGAGALTLPPLFAAVFAAPPLRGAAAGYVAAFFLLAATAYAVFQVPYVTMPAEMTQDGDERARVLGWRVGFLGVAILLPAAVAPAVAHEHGDTPASYRLMGVVVALFLLAGMLGAWHFTRQAPSVARSIAEPSLRAQLAAVRDNQPFMYLAGMWTLQALAVGIMLAGVQYYATYVFGGASTVTSLFVCMISPLVLVMPLWNRLARARGVKYAQWCASLLFAAAAALLAFTPYAGARLGYPAVAAVGMAYAGLQLLPLTMLADTLAADAVRSGRRRAATFTGLWTAAETMAFAVGAGAFALVLATSGYRSSDAAHYVDQPDSALTGITVGMSLLPAFLATASLWLLHRYREDPIDLVPGTSPSPIRRTGRSALRSPTPMRIEPVSIHIPTSSYRHDYLCERGPSSGRTVRCRGVVRP
ncbi:MFS transporter [Streptomyces sp. NPDC088354]|uniref:MFS transporter n=1 Tax=Streptomyces sp. NPDC088354 TaxID=3365856 RepID=UPI0037FFC34C